MSRFPFWKRVWLVMGLTIPVVIFFVGRSAVSWRPQLIGRQSNVFGEPFGGSRFLHLSSDEKWLVSEPDTQKTSTLWDLSGRRAPHNLRGIDAVFSSDCRLVTTYDFQSSELFLDDGLRLKWRKKIHTQDEPRPSFAENDLQLRYYGLAPYADVSSSGGILTRDLVISLDAKTGKQIGQKDLGVARWQRDNVMKGDEFDRWRISFVPSGSDEAAFSFETTNEFDRWRLSPDGKRLWVSLGKQNRFEIRDAKSGHKLWSWLSDNKGGGEFDNFPSWEDGGKTLAIIENDALIVRDSDKGKVLLSHKNNLPDALKSWAFSRDMGTVYLMDDEGDIYRQRLR